MYTREYITYGILKLNPNDLWNDQMRPPHNSHSTQVQLDYIKCVQNLAFDVNVGGSLFNLLSPPSSDM